MNTFAVKVASAEASRTVEAAADQSIEDRFRAAVGVTYRHWACTNPDDQFIAACDALYRSSSVDEKVRIESELHRLRDLHAMLSGVPVDIDVMLERWGSPDAPTPIGLRKIWDEVTA